MRRIVIAAFDGVGLLDVTGPAEVFSAASRLVGTRRKGYEIQIAAQARGPVRTAAGVTVTADVAWSEVGAQADTVIVPGGLDVDRAGARPHIDAALIEWLRADSHLWRRVASVCAGAHMLAAAGLLDGCRATTHWFTADRLALDHPAVEVQPDPIFVRAGRVWTSAGVSSGMDLALAMVADDHSEELSRRIAQWLVMYLRRPGGQSQFSVPLSTLEPRSDKIRELRIWVLDNLQADLSVAALARHTHMSQRHFARLFAEQMATTPAAYVEANRAEAARRMLEQTDAAMDVVASRCGFGSVETFYRTFRRRLGTTPNEYRQRFRLTALPAG